MAKNKNNNFKNTSNKNSTNNTNRSSTKNSAKNTHAQVPDNEEGRSGPGGN